MNSNKHTGEYLVERLSITNLSNLEKLYIAVYGKIPAVNFFHLKYDTAFTGAAYIGYIAYNKEQLPVAFYGVIPCFIQFKNKTILAAQSADTMTHPQYRNKGLFTKLAALTFQLCRETGIRVIFGFPNQNSLHGFINKLGWHTKDRMDCFIIRAGLFSWESLFGKLGLKNLYAGYQRNILKKYLQPQHGIANSVFSDRYGGVHRDCHYFAYKTYNPTQVIKLGPAILWIKINRELLIGDISVKPDDFDDFVKHLKKLTRKLGIKRIQFHTSQGTSLHTLFSSLFISTPSFPVIFRDMGSNIALDKIKFTSADIDTF